MTIATSTARLAELTAAGMENNPFVAFDNVAAEGIAVTPGSTIMNALNGTTYDYWMSTNSPTLTVVFPEPRVISFVGMAAHNLNETGASVRVQKSMNGGANWSQAAGGINPIDGGVIGFRLETAQSAATTHWRINVQGGSATAAVGVVFMGQDLVIPDRFYQGFAPPLTPNQVELQSNVSQGGNLLGNAVIQRGSVLNADFQHVPEPFIRSSDWLRFQRHFNDGKGFFFGWRPQKYPQDTWYAWREGSEIAPFNGGPRAMMSFGMNMRAYNG